MGKSLEGVLRTFQKKMKRAVSPLPPFKELFHKFREVLASHNKAVEMIADMGEKLSGDYLFDVTYIESAYAELSTAVWGSIKSFDSFTRGRYPISWTHLYGSIPGSAICCPIRSPLPAK